MGRNKRHTRVWAGLLALSVVACARTVVPTPTARLAVTPSATVVAASITDTVWPSRTAVVQMSTASPAPTATQVLTTVTPRPQPSLVSSSHTPTLEAQIPYVKCLVVTPDDPPVYYLVVGDSLYESADRGASWSAVRLEGVPEGVAVTTVAIDYQHPESMYLGTDRGLYRREGRQSRWELVNTLRVVALAVDMLNSDVLWAGTPWNTELRAVIVKSEDRGHTWGKADDGVSAGEGGAWVNAILIDPNNPNVLWAHVRPWTRHDWPQGLVYRGGRDGHWEQLPLGEAYDSTNTDRWNHPDMCFVSGLAYDPSRNALYAGCDISYYNAGRRSYRLLRSLNADASNTDEVSWDVVAELAQAPENTLATNCVRPLAVDARQPKSIFVFLELAQAPGLPQYRLLVSHDDGGTWQDIGLKGLPGYE